MDKQQWIRTLAWVAMVGAMLSLSSCNKPGDSAAGDTTDSEAPASPAAIAQPAAPSQLPAAPPAQASPPVATPPPPAPIGKSKTAPSPPRSGPEAKPEPPPLSPGADAGRACRTDSDCAMKDAGSCCGYYPVCVNKDTPTFPEKVKAACANEGRVGICGFPAIDGCQCVAGKCAGVPIMENSVLLQ